MCIQNAGVRVSGKPAVPNRDIVSAYRRRRHHAVYIKDENCSREMAI
jgi:hypothetical protein